MARARVITIVCVSWFSIQLCFAQIDTSGSAGSSNSLNSGETNKPGPNQNTLNSNNSNNPVGGFSPMTRFHPLLGYSSFNNQNSNGQSYYDPQNLKHHHGQGYYPPHNHQHQTPNYLPETGNYNYGNPKGILYPLPFGYYPPNYGTSSTNKPLPSTTINPYPIPTTLGGSTTGYPPFPSSHVPHYPHVHGHNFGQVQAPVVGGGYYNDGFDVGTLPQQVRVPGAIKVAITGKDAEITCEFPKYLILMQGIYWHHKYNDPFGTYYDAQNGYGARVTVTAIDQWKSALYIRDYTVDDFGTYRCISAAILPAESEPHHHPQNPYTFATRSSDTGSTTDRNRINLDRNIPTNSETPPIYEFESSESKSSEDAQLPIFTTSTRKPASSRYLKNSRKMKFPADKSKSRFRRRRQSDYNELTTEASNFEMPGEQTTYDPFFASENIPKSNFLHRNNYYYPESVLHNSYHHAQPPPNYQHLSNPYTNPEFQSYLPQYLPNQHSHQDPSSQYNPNQNPRHLPHYYYPGFGFGSTTPIYPPSSTSTPNFGLQIPYYKPSYSYFTVYQEVSFQPTGVASRQTPILSSTPYSNLG